MTAPSIDIEAIRADTPAVRQFVHLNNAGSSLPPTPVVDAVVDYLRFEADTGGYEAADQRSDDLAELYRATARLLNCEPSEVAFTSSASDAWWRAFCVIPLEAGDRVLMSRSEFQANAFGLLQARDRGVDIGVVPNDEAGDIDLDALAAMLDERVRLVSLTQISMSNGAVHPAAEVGKLAREAGAIYILDACQAAGQRRLDVAELGCDFLVYTGRKFMRGPRGTGILYAREAVLDRLAPSPFIDGRSAEWTGPTTYRLRAHAQRFEFGEQNFAGKVGLARATNYVLDVGIDAIAERVTSLADRLRLGLSGIDGVDVRDEGTDRCGIVTFTLDSMEPSEVKSRLSASRIQMSAPDQTNAQLDIGARGLAAVVRAGVHYFNTEAEIDTTLETVALLAGAR